MKPLLFIICLALAGCDHDRGCNNGTVHNVPDVTGWDVLAIVIVALAAAAIVERWLKGDKL